MASSYQLRLWKQESFFALNAFFRSLLGYMYYYGHSAQRDRAQACDLFQKAAARGKEDAKWALECSRKGISIDHGAGLRGFQ
jgi:TPR repeat protein